MSADHTEAEGVVQQAWRRLNKTDPVIIADDAAIFAGTPDRIKGAREIATFFDGSARTALSVFAYDRPGTALFDRSEVKVLIDVTITVGVVRRITFRADTAVLTTVERRSRTETRG